MTKTPAAILLMGPTASGKTALAVELIQRLPLEIVSVDSALVYRGMDIGTSKPGPDILRRAPHRLIDICDPAEAYSAARFCQDAINEMASIREAGRIPLLVGGTMLYFRALQTGLSELPPAHQGIRAELHAAAASQGWAALHRRLAEVDAVAARRIHPNDPQRIQRALEVYYLTGAPMSALLQQSRGTPLLGGVLKVVVAPQERSMLHTRIEYRFHDMLDQGFVAEVARLYNRTDLNPELPSMRAVGYRQVWDYLAGHYGYDEMVRRGVAATRQLAKRQFTWLRAESNTEWLESTDKGLLESTLRILSKAYIC